jgi:hypothetical protein
MEEKTNQKRKALRTMLVALAVIAVAGGAYYYIRENSFCFDFTHNTQFGDKTDLKEPSNEGFMGPGGNVYYVPETSALQTALLKEGFYIDEFETTGGGVYLTSFFGPSTKAAVTAFQEKYDLAPIGEVNNNTIDKLRELHGCTAPQTGPSEAAAR